MIYVLADDFTGAAEIAGIAWRCNVDSEIIFGSDLSGQSQMIIIDTDTRSQDEFEVKKNIRETSAKIFAVHPSWIYKKTDSILRGHVLAELQILQNGLGKNRVILIPANPSLGRTISNGTYYVNGIPLEHTDFSEDPEYPRLSSKVTELLGTSTTNHIFTVTSSESVPAEGFIVGETSNRKDLEHFAALVDDKTLPAGGSEFFLTILKIKKMAVKNRYTGHYVPGKKRLIIIGSSSAQSRQNLHNLNRHGVAICKIPCAINNTANLSRGCAAAWSEEIIRMFKNNAHVAAAIDQPVRFIRALTRNLADCTAQMVSTVLEKISIDELIIEGGTTASRVIRHLGWNHLRPTAELQSGVVALHIPENPQLKLIVKPGSYAWPELLSG